MTATRSESDRLLFFIHKGTMIMAAHSFGIVGSAIIALILGVAALPALADPITTETFVANYNTSLDATYAAGGSRIPLDSYNTSASTSTYKYGGGSLDATAPLYDDPTLVRYDGGCMSMTGTGTVALWVNPTWSTSTNSDTHVFFEAQSADGSLDIWLGVSGNTLMGQVNGSSMRCDFRNAGMDAGNWYYVQFNWSGLDNDGGTAWGQLYLNGSRKVNKSVTAFDVTSQSITSFSVGGRLQSDPNLSGATPQNAGAYLDGVVFSPVRLGSSVPSGEVAPEPATCVLLGMGAVLLRRRRQLR